MEGTSSARTCKPAQAEATAIPGARSVLSERGEAVMTNQEKSPDKNEDKEERKRAVVITPVRTPVL